MKKLLVLLFLAFIMPSFLLSKSPEQMQLLEPNQTLEILNSIKHDAIVFGEGDSAIHTFIDPYCELSQRYLSFIFDKQERMFSKYTFYFYLYELNGKNSSDVITTILSSEYKNTALKAVMLDHEDIEYDDNEDAQNSVDEIKSAAEKIGVFKRPYILINGKVK